MSSDLSILILSCDRYADLWPLFFQLFEKQWPDCPYPVYLGANQKSFEHPRVRMLYTGEDRSWAESAAAVVRQIPTKYVLILLEDFLLLEPVQTGKIESGLNALRSLQGGYLRLKPFPKPDHKIAAFPEIGEIERGAPYRVSLQAAIWNCETFLKLALPGETAWDMELIGTQRSETFSEGFYSTWKPALVYRAGVTFGKWVPFAVDLCRGLGVEPDLTARPMMTEAENSSRNRRVWIGQRISGVPWKWRRAVKRLLVRMGLRK